MHIPPGGGPQFVGNTHVWPFRHAWLDPDPMPHVSRHWLSMQLVWYPPPLAQPMPFCVQATLLVQPRIGGGEEFPFPPWLLF